MGIRKDGKLWASALVGVAAGLPAASGILHAATAAQDPVQLYIEEDAFYNYDFIEQGTVARDKVDWPVTLIYYNNAEIDMVKSLYWIPTGTAQNGKVNDGAGWVWDTDAGTKEEWCPVRSSALHLRLYADGDDMLYNTSWGYWVLGTTHYDTRECGWSPQFGYSEDAENEIANITRDWYGLTVLEDWGWFWNEEGDVGSHQPRWEGNHAWLNDGFGTAIDLP